MHMAPLLLARFCTPEQHSPSNVSHGPAGPQLHGPMGWRIPRSDPLKSRYKRDSHTLHSNTAGVLFTSIKVPKHSAS